MKSKMINRYRKITVCLDMAGCPNRCRHCWIGHSKNKMLPQSDLAYAAQKFEKYCEELAVYSWYREPDYRDDYRRLWEFENRLSRNCAPQRYELLSVWRLFRDKGYINWLKSFDIKKYQLTFFGMEQKTDYYTGRKGAFEELLFATETLLENGLMPRWQVFAYHDNVREIGEMLDLSHKMRLEEKCRTLGGEFDIFFHQGSCEGAGRSLYGNRLTSNDLKFIPNEMIDLSMKHFGCGKYKDFLGKPECELALELKDNGSNMDIVSDTPVFFVNGDLDVYPNFSETSEWFLLGNLKKDGAQKIINNYRNNKSFAQKAGAEIPLSEMVRSQGDENSNRLFLESDYKAYLLNTYCEKAF